MAVVGFEGKAILESRLKGQYMNRPQTAYNLGHLGRVMVLRMKKHFHVQHEVSSGLVYELASIGESQSFKMCNPEGLRRRIGWTRDDSKIHMQRSVMPVVKQVRPLNERPEKKCYRRYGSYFEPKPCDFASGDQQQ
jgi:hypothetical protein